MSDGSGMGITSDRALKTILGGEESPGEEEVQTKDQVRERIRNATADSYEGATDCITRCMIRTMKDDPDSREFPLDPPRAFVMRGTGETIGRHSNCRVVRADTYTKTDWVEEPETVYVEHVNSLWATAKNHAVSDDEREAFDGATGFMAGFAYNQAHWLMDLPLAPNPAIIEIG